jgi:hypothetical protein
MPGNGIAIAERLIYITTVLHPLSADWRSGDLLGLIAESNLWFADGQCAWINIALAVASARRIEASN